jgi:hypothetical protein
VQIAHPRRVTLAEAEAAAEEHQDDGPIARPRRRCGFTDRLVPDHIYRDTVAVRHQMLGGDLSTIQYQRGHEAMEMNRNYMRMQEPPRPDVEMPIRPRRSGLQFDTADTTDRIPDRITWVR